MPWSGLMNRKACAQTMLLLGTVFCCAVAASQTGPSTDVSLDRLSKAAKVYFRDTAELPMNIAVTTVVTDAAGKLKRQSQGSVDFLFHGYNPRSDKGTFTVSAGIFKRGAMKESMGGNNAVVFAGLMLRDGLQATPSPEILQPAGAGQPFIVRLNATQCQAFKLKESSLFPGNYCGRWEYRLTESGNDLRFEHFSFDSAGLPTQAKIAYLGDVQVLGFHFDEDFQQAFLPGDAKPFLLPTQVVTTITTDRGTVTITNQYAPRDEKAVFQIDRIP